MSSPPPQAYQAMIDLVAPRLETRDGYVAVWVLEGEVKAPGVSVWPEGEKDKAVAYAAAQASLYSTSRPAYVVAKDEDGFRVYEASVWREGRWWPSVAWSEPEYVAPFFPRLRIGPRARPSLLAEPMLVG